MKDREKGIFGHLIINVDTVRNVNEEIIQNYIKEQEGSDKFSNSKKGN